MASMRAGVLLLQELVGYTRTFECFDEFVKVTHRGDAPWRCRKQLALLTAMAGRLASAE